MCLLWFIPIIVPKKQLLDTTPTIYLLERSPGYPLMLNLACKKDSQKLASSKSKYAEQLKKRLKYAKKKAKQMASKQQERHKGLYDQRCRGMN